MANRYDLHHWNNSRLKNAIVLFLCLLKNRIYLVYDKERKAVATFQTKKIGNALRFQKLATAPAYAGKGVGSFCIEAIEGIAKSMGCEKVVLEVYDKSEHAKKFYEHRGYSVSGNVITLKYSELKMEKCI